MEELQLVWGWQPALYLYLGGVSAGAFITAALLYLHNKEGHRRTINGSMWVSTISLIVGLLFLVSELIHPFRGLLLWQSFSNSSSWMTLGAWIIFAAVIVFGLAAIVTTDKFGIAISKKWSAYANIRGTAGKLLSIIGIILGVAVAVYTGVLLMSAPGIPLWNTWLLPLIFTVSALDTGIALVEIVSIINSKKEKMEQEVHRLMNGAIILLVILEAVALMVFAFIMSSGGSGAAIIDSASNTSAESIAIVLHGTLAPVFWILVVTLGLVMPLVVAVINLVKHCVRKTVTKKVDSLEADPALKNIGENLSSSEAPTDSSSPIDADSIDKTELSSTEQGGNLLIVIGATGALIGGCALRFIVLLAGLHTDYVGSAANQLFEDMLSHLPL